MKKVELSFWALYIYSRIMIQRFYKLWSYRNGDFRKAVLELLPASYDKEEFCPFIAHARIIASISKAPSMLTLPSPPQIKKAFHKSESKKEFSVVTNLSTMAVCATSPLLPTAVSSQDLKPHQVVVPHVQVRRQP